MKKMKVMGTGVLVLMLMLFCAFSSSAANYEEFTYKDIIYTVLSDGTIKTVSYIGESKSYSLPSQINGKKVTVIGTHTFTNCKNLTTLTIPGSVRELEDMAVAYCPKLLSITVKQGSLKEIDAMSFYSCRALKTVSLPKNISSFSFMYECEKVEKVTFNSKNPYYKSYDGVVYSKDNKTLVYYPPGKKASYFIVPDSVRVINRTAFNAAKNLQGVFIHKKVEEIGETAFGYTSVTIYYEGSKIPQNLEAAFYPWEVVLNSPALKQVQNVKASSVTATSFTLKWNSVPGATGYRVYLYDSAEKTYKVLATTSKTTYKLSKLENATAHKIIVKAYAKTLSGNVWSDESKLTVKTLLVTPKISVNSKDGKVVLKWDKIPSATGYVIYVSQNKNSGYKKLTTTKKLTHTISDLEKNKTYYFKIKAYVKSGSSNIYSGYSAVKSAKVK